MSVNEELAEMVYRSIVQPIILQMASQYIPSDDLIGNTLRAQMHYTSAGVSPEIINEIMTFNHQGISSVERVMPDLGTLKSEYLHTIKLATPTVVKPTAVGTTYKVAKP